MSEKLTISIVKPSIKMLTPLDHARFQLALCAYHAGLSHGHEYRTYLVDELGPQTVSRREIGIPCTNTTDVEKFYSFPEAENLISKLLNMKPYAHESILEHGYLSFVCNCSRIMSHELVRHRHTGFTQMSTRYCEERGRVAFIQPPGMDQKELGDYQITVDKKLMAGWMMDDNKLPEWAQIATENVLFYRRARDSGTKRESARYLLPHCIQTWIGFTTNFRELRHMVQLRAEPPAAPEIQSIFKEVRSKLNEVSSVLLENL